MYAQFLTEQVKKLTTTTTVKRHKIQSLELPLISALHVSFSGNSHTSQTLQFSVAAPATTAPAYKSEATTDGGSHRPRERELAAVSGVM